MKIANQKSLDPQIDQSNRARYIREDSSFATLLCHCRARLMVIVFLVLLRQGLLLLSYPSLLFLYQLLFQVKYDVFLHWLTSVRGSFLSFVREQLVVIHYMDVVRQR